MTNPQDESFKATTTWYEDADTYWKTVPSSVDGMLGGLEVVHAPDIRDSAAFLTKLSTEHKLATNYACDCGAGIGRVTKHLLLQKFATVDLVEQNAQFLETAATTYLEEEKREGRIGDLFPVGLQGFTPTEGRYDVIWCQWVLSHLTDDDLVAFFERCVTKLAPNGLICIKENVASRGYVVDSDDSSVTRSEAVFEKLFQKARLEIVEQQVQTDFPSGLFEVKMWALRSI
ncbi:hypothetical protein H4S02_001027 [Coemansia sp. RSA 2611]|nr:hypothetical protein LPJ70_003043 [Coemansia sp. RSA 2708]KAJ2368601.1 hypothetical protein H4S01_001500 [Coemansia sp. RSA 2610]KAJ2391986.1 hypothetical protein H4S02_001027 [Coemansia sp. RSA 2611]